MSSFYFFQVVFGLLCQVCMMEYINEFHFNKHLEGPQHMSVEAFYYSKAAEIFAKKRGQD